MDKTEIEIARGDRAAQLLAEPLLIEAFAELEQEWMQAWLDSPIRDYEAREELYRRVQSLKLVWQRLETVLDTGKIAKATLAQQARELGRKLNPFS